MSKILLAALTLSMLTLGVVAKADDFAGQQNQQNQQTGVNAYLDDQATNSQLADPTARDSIRSHGHP